MSRRGGAPVPVPAWARGAPAPLAAAAGGSQPGYGAPQQQHMQGRPPLGGGGSHQQPQAGPGPGCAPAYAPQQWQPGRGSGRGRSYGGGPPPAGRFGGRGGRGGGGRFTWVRGQDQQQPRQQQGPVQQQGGGGAGPSLSRAPAPLIPCHGISPAMRAYIDKWSPLVAQEQAEQQRQAEERLRTWPLARLRAQGYALLGVRARRCGSLFDKSVYKLSAGEGGPLPFNRFTCGTEVLLTQRGPSEERPITATVMERSRFDVKIVVEGARLQEGPWRMDVGANMIPFERMQAALNALQKARWRTAGAEQQQEAPGGGGTGKSGKKAKKRQREEEAAAAAAPVGTPLAEFLVSLGGSGGGGGAGGGGSGGEAAGGGAEAAAAPADVEGEPPLPAELVQWAAGVTARWRGAAHDALAGEDEEIGLNGSQALAVVAALTGRVTLIQGPPGTGKTTTIVKLLALLAERAPGVPVLACAQSNVAVDNMLEGLTDLGVSALRVGQPVKVRESLRGATLDARIAAHPLAPQIEQEGLRLQEAVRATKTAQGRDKGFAHRDAQRLRNSLAELRAQMLRDVVGGAEVVCATCVGAGGDQLAGVEFPVVVLDEGSQCCEPEALIPLTKGARHALLVGDDKQLPPTCASAAAAAAGLGVSLFERLGRALGSSMLQVQYRMHPSLSAFPSGAFYGGALLDGVTAAQRPPPAFPWPNPEHPVVFIDVKGCEEVTAGGSKLNDAEARGAARVVAHLLANGEGAGTIGVVTPYTAQQALLSDQLGPIAAARGAGIAGGDAEDGGDDGGGGGGALEIKTVDGYQGREKEVIVFSTVRANAAAEVGFLADVRRLNVAITRARRGLIILGDADTLGGSDQTWAAYLGWLRARRCVVGAQEFGLLGGRLLGLQQQQGGAV